MASGYVTSDGKDLDDRFLGKTAKAASATKADTATRATNATNANYANSAGYADSAGIAVSKPATAGVVYLSSSGTISANGVLVFMSSGYREGGDSTEDITPTITVNGVSISGMFGQLANLCIPVSAGQSFRVTNGGMHLRLFLLKY